MRPINAPRVIIHRLKNIGAACDVSGRTIENWVRRHGFPVFHLPSGHVTTTVGMIEAWAQERREKELQERMNGGKIVRHQCSRGYRVRVKSAS